MDLARRAIRKIQSRNRNRPGDLFLSTLVQRSRARGRLARFAGGAHLKLAHGILAMLVTPFTDDYRLNEDALRREVQWAIAAGAQGLVAAPSIGEFLHLDEAERTRVFEIVIEETRKRANLSAVAMTSGATTLETLRSAKIAAGLGYDAQQVIPPYYWRCGEAEVERHYRMVAEAGGPPGVIYLTPALTPCDIS